MCTFITVCPLTYSRFLGGLMYKSKLFVNDRELKAINILRDNLKEQYLVFFGVRLSEFFYPESEYGSDDFFREFEEINGLTLPVIIYDSIKNKIEIILSFDEINQQGTLQNVGLECIRLSGLADILSHEKLLTLYAD
ncbi:DNA distortion polypeptide 3 [Salmonella enterica]|nr:DNA distortion polypeptide 3 [Salmonella enterica]